MSTNKRYIPLTSREIQLYRREKAIQETKREEKTNNALIALRKKNLAVINAFPNLKAKIERFNYYVKNKKIEDIAKVIHYLVSDLYEQTQETKLWFLTKFNFWTLFDKYT